ncbi:hypothetical protein FEV53_13525 [Palleronia caenipelagi]|uniref:Uncharacterized protein n=2 Tax=Palleronia caenipelagi TaxID=2489174 RepID=A0A547PS87_9RHOB|nr:hypothetical protein FEV53_13525 [Palleronia caenipelagi]
MRAIDIGGGQTVIATDIEHALRLAAAIIGDYVRLPPGLRAAHLDRNLEEAFANYSGRNQSST